MLRGVYIHRHTLYPSRISFFPWRGRELYFGNSSILLRLYDALIQGHLCFLQHMARTPRSLPFLGMTTLIL